MECAINQGIIILQTSKNIFLRIHLFLNDLKEVLPLNATYKLQLDTVRRGNACKIKQNTAEIKGYELM